MGCPRGPSSSRPEPRKHGWLWRVVVVDREVGLLNAAGLVGVVRVALVRHLPGEGAGTIDGVSVKGTRSTFSTVVVGARGIIAVKSVIQVLVERISVITARQAGEEPEVDRSIERSASCAGDGRLVLRDEALLRGYACCLLGVVERAGDRLAGFDGDVVLITLAAIAAHAAQFPIGRDGLRSIVARSRKDRAAVMRIGCVGEGELLSQVRRAALEREVEALRVATRVSDLVNDDMALLLGIRERTVERLTSRDRERYRPRRRIRRAVRCWDGAGVTVDTRQLVVRTRIILGHGLGAAGNHVGDRLRLAVLERERGRRRRRVRRDVSRVAEVRRRVSAGTGHLAGDGRSAVGEVEVAWADQVLHLCCARV